MGDLTGWFSNWDAKRLPKRHVDLRLSKDPLQLTPPRNVLNA
jgi:hypothetical protein